MKTTTTPILRSWRTSSAYPDAWARPCVAWICRRLDVRSAHVQITNTRPRGGNGRAWLCANRVLLRLNRRHPRLEWQYSTMPWDRSRPVSGTLEAFVFLAAHELALAWERRRTRAENAIKKLNRRRAGIIAAQTRKAAAHRPSA